MVCNGHYSDVRRAELPGAESFPGTVVHSHSYRDNQAFKGLTVIVIGASASGEDICREIALTADKVGPYHHVTFPVTCLSILQSEVLRPRPRLAWEGLRLLGDASCHELPNARSFARNAF